MQVKPSHSRSGRYTLLILVVLATLAFILVMVVNRWGIGADPDSCVYVCAAENLANGEGLRVFTSSGTTEPLVHFPPLYSTVLAMFAIAGIETLAAAKVLCAFLFGANVFLVGFIVCRYTRGSWFAPVICSLLFLTCYSSIVLNSEARPESLYVFLAMLGLLLVTEHLEASTSRRRTVLLVLSALAFSLAFLARYAGGSLVLTSILVIMLWGKGSFPKRLRDCGILLAISTVPMIAWLVRNSMAEGGSPRKTGWHPISLSNVNRGITTLRNWLFPFKGRALAPVVMWLLFGLVLTITLVIIILAFRYPGARETQQGQEGGKRFLLRVLGLYVAIYLVYLVVSISLFDAYIRLDERILYPALAAVLVIVVCAGHDLYVRAISPGGKLTRLLFGLLVAVILASFAVTGVQKCADIYRGGLHYSSRTWKRSGTIAFLESLPEETVIYTNANDAVYLLMGRNARAIPPRYDPVNALANPGYELEMEAMREELEKGEAVLAYFWTVDRYYFPDVKQIREFMREGPGGVTFKAASKARDGKVFSFVQIDSP